LPGFTLVEALVVLSIIFLLTSVALHSCRSTTYITRKMMDSTTSASTRVKRATFQEVFLIF